MAGTPFKVGRFAHTLRVRLMREHLGVDVDAMYEEDLMAQSPANPDFNQEVFDPDDQQEKGQEFGPVHYGKIKSKTGVREAVKETMDSVKQGVFSCSHFSKLLEPLQPYTGRLMRHRKTLVCT